jgi:N-formylglutamate amidohydrolase
MTGNAVIAAREGLAAEGSPDPGLDELVVAPVDLRLPARLASPFVFASPHSGRTYPSSFARATRLDAVTLRQSEDAYVDELFAAVTELGSPLIAARFPRAYVDANRAPNELDPAMFDAPVDPRAGPRTARVAAGLGVIPRIVRDGLEIYGARLPAREANFRIEHFYRPYHKALAKLTAAAHAKFGVAIIVDCHSMPPPSKGQDIVLGDCHGQSASPALSAEAQRLLGEVGFSVARNAPYAGGYTTSLYGRPYEKTHAIQIEVSRALYLDERRMEPNGSFHDCRARLLRFAERLLTSRGTWLN